MGDSPNMSDTNLLLTVEDLINISMGPPEENRINFKVLQTVLHILARQLRLLEHKVEIRSMKHEPKTKSKGGRDDKHEQASSTKGKGRGGKHKDEDGTYGTESAKGKRDRSFGKSGDSSGPDEGKGAKGKGGKGGKGGRSGGKSGDSDDEDRKHDKKGRKTGDDDEDRGKRRREDDESDEKGRRAGKRGRESEISDADVKSGKGKKTKGGKRGEGTESGADRAGKDHDRESDDDETHDSRQKKGRRRGGDQEGESTDGRHVAGTTSSGISITESKRGKDKVLVVEKGPKTRRTSSVTRPPVRVGSVEVVSRSQFDRLRDVVEQLQTLSGPIPAPTLPDNKKLRSDIAKGRASLTDTMQTMQVNARVEAAEQAILRMTGMLTNLAASGALPAEMAHQIQQTQRLVTEAQAASAAHGAGGGAGYGKTGAAGHGKEGDGGRGQPGEAYGMGGGGPGGGGFGGGPGGGGFGGGGGPRGGGFGGGPGGGGGGFGGGPGGGGFGGGPGGGAFGGGPGGGGFDGEGGAGGGGFGGGGGVGGTDAGGAYMTGASYAKSQLISPDALLGPPSLSPRPGTEFHLATMATTDNKDCITYHDLENALRFIRDEIMRSMHDIALRSNTNAENALQTAKNAADKLNEAMEMDKRITELNSIVADYAEQLKGFDVGFNTQMANFQDQMSLLKSELQTGFEQMAQAGTNSETAAVMELNERYESLLQDLDSTISAHATLNAYQKSLEEQLRLLIENLEALREQKADRDEVQDGLRDKADNSRLAGLLSEEDFAIARADLECRISLCYEKFDRQDHVWQIAIKDLMAESESKAELMQLLSTREEVQRKLNQINDELQHLATIVGEPMAALLTRKLAKDAHCAVCMVPALMRPTEKTYGAPPPLPALRPPVYGGGDECFRQMLAHPPETREHVCQRWCGGSHTVVSRGGGAAREHGALEAAPEREVVAGFGTDGKMYVLEKELQPCLECNVIYPAENTTTA